MANAIYRRSRVRQPESSRLIGCENAHSECNGEERNEDMKTDSSFWIDTATFLLEAVCFPGGNLALVIS